jgi:hypothetical protein
MDILAEVYDEKHDLIELLEKTNSRLKLQHCESQKHGVQTLSKCAESGCWLFIVKPEKLVDEIKISFV